MCKENTIKLVFSENFFKKGDIVIMNNITKVKVISTPKCNKFRRLLHFITFGIVPIIHYYKVKKLDE